MKNSTFSYGLSGNLGDQIQSLACEQFLTKIDKRFDRDALKEVTEEEKYMTIMQGWFSHTPERCFPPSASIVPVFYGFHIANQNDNINHFLNPASVSYFKQHQPIGCRDRKTMEMLINYGVDAFYSKCLTLTFPKREAEPQNGKVYLVDVENMKIPEAISKEAISVSHIVNPLWGEEIKYLMAKKLLNLYRDDARLVITKRLHCALPCIAMGIPVVFFGNPDDYRISIIKDLNIPINPIVLSKENMPNQQSIPPKFPFLNFLRKIETKTLEEDDTSKIDWNPTSILFEEEKKEIISNLNRLIRRTIERNS
ncbi:MAG: polysaccharide pyruvyl transferase family protein [Mariniphaga sp.]